MFNHVKKSNIPHVFYFLPTVDAPRNRKSETVSVIELAYRMVILGGGEWLNNNVQDMRGVSELN